MIKTCFLALALGFSACSSLGRSAEAGQSPRLSAFEADETCPRVCWLGINPGVTRMDTAKRVLQASDQIDRARFYRETASSIQTVWKTDESDTYWANVWLISDGDLVQSIRFGTVAPFTLDDLIVLLGQPDAVVIGVDHTVDGGDIVTYAVYFSKFKASLAVYPASPDGPSPTDVVESLVLNSEFLYPENLNDAGMQPWLGYGMLQEYLRANPTPSQ